jgi:hypothetical protein
MRGLIVERHAWETGAGRQQLQFPQEAFKTFFGTAGEVQVDLYSSPWLTRPSREIQAQVSAYQPSGTYRLNRVYEIANIGGVFVCINETGREREDKPVYELWWERDLAMVAANFDGWKKAKDSQYGRGRLWIVLDSVLDRPVAWTRTT